MPQSLEDLYFSILDKEYPTDDYYAYQIDPNFPKEFKSGEWWKKRGL